ncbi:MAG: glycosyltransferase [Parvibaculum sp.]|nr:glycosyltransferase [Parvibaculum sp.]
MPETELSVVIPVLNEEDIVEKNLRELASRLNTIVGAGKWKFVIVDNGSTDQTPQILKRVLTELPPSLSVFVPEPNYGAALRAGLAAADTDFAHPCDIEQWDIPFITWAWSIRHEHDLFIGSKRSDPTISKQTSRRRFLSWGLNALLQLMFGYMGTDTHGPKLIYMRKLRPVINSCLSDRGQFDTEIVLRSVRKGYRLAEAPIAFLETRPPRVRLFKKILWNLIAFNRLRTIIGGLGYSDKIEFRQFSRSDVLKATEALGAATTVAQFEVLDKEVKR